jgi:hypothetical protein
MKTKLEDPGVDKLGRRKPVRKLTSKALRFCDLVASGHSQAGAFRIAYKHPKMSADDAAERGWRITQQPGVKERIDELRKQSAAKTLLTLNDRLEILAEIAQSKTSKPSDKARAIEVYSRISGDQAPDRHEHTGPNGEPIAVAGTLLVGRLSRREKLEAIKARRAAVTP